MSYEQIAKNVTVNENDLHQSLDCV